MIQGRGYAVALQTYATGTSSKECLAIVGGANYLTVVTSVAGHFSNGDSSQNVSFSLIRASASTPGTSITPRPLAPDVVAATFTTTHTPTGVTTSGDPLAVFGGNGAANFGWYPSVEENQIILRPSDILILDLVVAPTSSLNMEATVYVTEI